jgi:hypothetical protein
LLSAEDSNGDIHSVNVSESDISRSLTYIPPRLQAVCENASGQKVKLVIGTNGEFLP